jgi:hypothetical protein
MKGRLLVLAGATVLLSSAVLAQGTHRKEFKRTLAFEPEGYLTLETYKGSIRLSSWEQNQVEITAEIEPAEDTSEAYARRSVEATEVDVWGSGRSVTIRSDYNAVPCEERFPWPACSKQLPYIRYVIRAPRKLNLRIKDHKSEIDLTELDGRLEVDTYKGTLRAQGLTGDVRLETYKGTAKGVGLRGRLRAETYKGEMSLEATLEDRSQLETYKGTIELQLPASQRLSVRGEIGRRGDFVSDFEMAMRALGGERLEGHINGGGPELEINSHRGTIRLRRR